MKILKEKSKKKSALNVESIADVLESYNFIEYKKLNGLYELSYFLYDLDEESVNLIDDIESVIRKNSVVRVRQLYDSYPKCFKWGNTSWNE